MRSVNRNLEVWYSYRLSYRATFHKVVYVCFDSRKCNEVCRLRVQYETATFYNVLVTLLLVDRLQPKGVNLQITRLQIIGECMYLGAARYILCTSVACAYLVGHHAQSIAVQIFQWARRAVFLHKNYRVRILKNLFSLNVGI